MSVPFLVGSVATGGYLLLIGFWWLRFPRIRYAIVIGAVVRLVLAWLIGLQLVEIPGTTNDARAFERRAGDWAELPWGELLLSFDPSHSYVISWVGAILYKIAYPSSVMLNIVNAAVSVWLVVLTYHLAARLFGYDRAKIAAWVVALFPFAVLYGSVFRREVFGSALFMLGLLKGISWVRTQNPFLFLSAFFLFLAAGVFHAGYAAGAVGLLVFSVSSICFGANSSSNFSIKNSIISGLLASVLGAMLVVGLLFSGISFNKIGELGEIDIAEAVEARTLHRVSEGGSSYPDFLRGVDPFAKPWVIPGRIVYFLFSPFPWDIKSASHLLGIFASVLFLSMFRSIFISRHMILRNREAFLVLIVTVMAVLVFAISIDNIGTSIRHRTKFVYPLIALCAMPLFYSFRFRLRLRRWR